MRYEIETRFDQTLLSKSIEERVSFFKHKLLNHTHLSNSYALALDNIKFASAGETVVILGARGVGTTVLGKKIWKHFQNRTPNVSEVNANSVWIEAPSHAGKVDLNYWKCLLTAALTRAGQAAIDKTILVPQTDWQFLMPYPSSKFEARGVDIASDALANKLEQRGTRVLIINQAERLFPKGNKSGCLLSEQMLTDLAGRLSVRIVLIGDYKLILSSTASDTWIKRQKLVHLRRYDNDSPSEMSSYISAVVELLGNMPIDRCLASVSEAFMRNLYLKTIGCVGSVKKCFHTSLQQALESGEKITEALLLSNCQDNVVAEEYALEANLGEGNLLDVTTKDIARALKRGHTSASDARESRTRKSGPDGKTPESWQKRRVGERNPTRDQTGSAYAM